MPHRSHQFPFKHATAAYVIALSLLTVTGVTGYGLLSYLHRQTAHDAALVNAAGRQRMLAQRVVRIALMSQFGKHEDERALRRSELATAVEQWDQGHEAVSHGESEPRISLIFGSDIRAASSNAQLASSRNRLARAVSGFLGTAGVSPVEDGFTGLCAACDDYVNSMDAFVFAIQADNETRTRNVGHALALVLAISTFLIILEGVLVFRPLVRRLRASHERLFEAHESLRLEVEHRRVVEAERDVLRGLVPICSGCKKIRDANGSWGAIERYIEDRSEARFSHGLCEECVRRLYPEVADRVLKNG